MLATFPATTDQPIDVTAPFVKPGAFPADTTESAQVEDADGAEEEIVIEDEQPAVAADEPADDSNSLIEEATSRHGFTKEEAESFGENLPAVLARLDRQAVSLMRDRLKAEQQESPKVVEGEKVAAPKAEPAAPAAKFEKFELNLDPDEYDEGTIKNFGALAAEINSGRQKMAEQNDMLTAMAQVLIETHGNVSSFAEQTQSASSAKFATQMDSLFSGLDDSYTDTYGTEPLSKLTADSPLLANRNKLIEEMHILELADQHVGRAKSSPQEYATRALRLLHADKAESQTRAKVSKEIAAQRKKAIARPSGRNGKQLSPRDRALANIEQKLAAMG